MLSKILVVLNNSIIYSSTTLALNQIVYNFKIKKALDLIRLNKIVTNDNAIIANITTNIVNTNLAIL